MEHHSFFPRSTRNRIAFALGLLSLLLFVTWNLMPYPEIPWGTSKRDSKITAVKFWPDMLTATKLAMSNVSSEYRLFILLGSSIATFLLALTVFAILPAWQTFQSSILLRFIPATVMLVGFSLYIFNLVNSVDTY